MTALRLFFDAIRHFPQSEIPTVIPLLQKISSETKALRDFSTSGGKWGLVKSSGGLIVRI